MDQDVFFIQKGAEKETLMTAKTEAERIEALKKSFGFSMNDEERNRILKLPSKL
ncbi:hypothetical protein MMC17_006298 [Xylographa soralifera]|nr:hypothetical protein [Xylographa soralifera]